MAHSKTKDVDYYAVRVVVIDDKGNIVSTSKPLLFLTKEQYEKFASK